MSASPNTRAAGGWREGPEGASWFRWWRNTVSDPKFAEIADIADCSISVALAAWAATLEDARRIGDGGRFEIPARRIAVLLREPRDTVERVLAAFDEIGLTDQGVVVKWLDRQPPSDSSTARVRKHREAKRQRQGNGDETLHDRSATEPETETETETEAETEPFPPPPVEE